MPLLRASAIIAVIFAFSPVREGAPPRVDAPDSRLSTTATTESPATAGRTLADAPADLERAHALWKALPEEARAELAERVAQELRRGISP
ncbi:hypothetical protein [Salinarimonas sp.]|uniref:hypothetical protein n=1 Tax=Salinarimonas sp. TaxID=2766526 RepID=UPI0032D94F61